jgi:uncharacterized protein (DUF2336 family)
MRADDQVARSDRLFRAAVSGFCSMTSPTRLDASRLDQLALPLLPLVSDESRRYAAAALSRSFPGPQGLIRRLAEDEIAISAPILAASPVLGDIDLIGLIGRHGLAHAAAVARRSGLNPNIAALIRALGLAEDREAEPADARAASDNAHVLPVETPAAETVAAGARQVPTGPVAAAFDDYVQSEPGAAEEAARDRLRSMMMPAGERAPSRAHPVLPQTQPAPDWESARAASGRLVSTGLAGKAALFHTAIADAFDLEFHTAVAIAEESDLSRLAIALKAASLPPAEAYLIAALAFPPRFATTAAIRGFIEYYAAIEVAAARAKVVSWRTRSPRADAVETAREALPAPANLSAPMPAPARMLKAS